MAEKNTESTAVNQLIELVATAKPLPPDPDEDLMFRPVSTAKQGMDPLPRARSPLGTQQGLQTIKQEVAHTIKAVPPGVRITTPSRSINIPPMTLDHDEDAEVTNPGPSTLSRPTTQGVAAQPPAPPTRATGSNAARLSGVHPVPAADPIASRVTRPTLPPPVPTMRPSAQTIRASSPPPAMPVPFRPSSQPTSDFSYPTLPALPSRQRAGSMPAVTAEVDPLTFDRPVADGSAVPSWIERDVGTQAIKRNDWKTIAGKLIGPMVVLVIAGIFIGGYFAFDGDGGKKRTPKANATEGTKVSMAATAPADTKSPAAPAAPAAVDPAANAADQAKADDAKVAADEAKADDAKRAADQTASNTAASNTAASNTAAPAPASNTASATAPVSNTAATSNTAASNTAASNTAAAPAAAKTAPAPITPPNLAATTPAPAKTADPAKPAASTGRPTLVDVRIDSSPSGATVMLIDRGKQTFLGTTPMSAAVDTSRKYELVFSYEGRATVVESLDPASQKKLSVKLSRAKTGQAAPAVAAPKSTAPAPRAPKIAAPAPKAEKSGIDAALESAEKKPAVEKAASGEGTLMISSKPPCEIYVDGKPTGLTTPQRAIMLPVGAHKVTLVNTAEGIKKTLSVQITADKPTKVIQDFMK